MSQLDEKIELYGSEMTKLNLTFDAALLAAVTKGLGPSIYNEDSSRVSGTDPEEIARVKNNFLIGKLGLADSPALDEAINEAIQTLGSANRNKYRAMFYYLLVKKFGKESVYGVS